MENRMFDLHGMTALVTGAAGGIGSAISHALAKQGARLALSGTNPAKLRAFREELNDTYGHDHVEITCDLSKTEQVGQKWHRTFVKRIFIDRWNRVRAVAQNLILE